MQQHIYFFKHSKRASFALHASNLVYDVIILSVTISTVSCYQRSSSHDFFSKIEKFLQNEFTYKLIYDLISQTIFKNRLTSYSLFYGNSDIIYDMHIYFKFIY